jgi:UTP--glucose-1-phosphate uridylyltransferase
VKAVIPAAGLGTRFLPVTKNSPKEMLPLVDKPAIQYVVEEAVSSGIDDIIIVTGRGKHAIEDHFDIAFELESVLKENNDLSNLKEVRKISELADIQYVRQKKSLGLGHAILCAKKHIGSEPFAVLLGDDVVFSTKPCTKQLIEKFEQYHSSIIAVEQVPSNRIETYGIIKYNNPVEKRLYPVVDLVEKPKQNKAPSNLGILGRYILTPSIFDCLEKTKPGYGGEIQLTDALRLLKETEEVFGFEFSGKRYDLGNKMDWLKTTFDVALMRDEFRDELVAFIKERMKTIDEGKK